MQCGMTKGMGLSDHNAYRPACFIKNAVHEGWDALGMMCIGGLAHLGHLTVCKCSNAGFQVITHVRSAVSYTALFD